MNPKYGKILKEKIEIFFIWILILWRPYIHQQDNNKSKLDAHMKDTQGFYSLFLKLNRKESNGMTSHILDFKTERFGNSH